MCRTVIAFLCCAVMLPTASAATRQGHRPVGGRSKLDSERLMRLVTPTGGRTKAAAHPFVNVVVRLGTTGLSVDPSTFRAHLGAVNVTPLFEPMLAQGQLTGMRAEISPALLRVGQSANHLRLDVRGRIGTRRVHDTDRVRFAAVDTPDGAPVARALASSDVLVAGVPTQFDGSQSSDPDEDTLTYLWDFGDGSTSTDVQPVHVFAQSATDATVRLTVSDGQLEASDEVTMLGVPPLCMGCTPGVLRVEAVGPLEFAAIPLGGSATRSFTVRNTDPNSTSDLHVRLATTGGAFTLSTTDLDLAGGQSASVDVTFAPTTGGHQSTDISLVASASNQKVVHLLTHGYGGSAPGTGPLPTSDPLFFAGMTGTEGIFPGGVRFAADDTVRSCTVPQNGSGTGDYCLTNADCASNHGTCSGAATPFGPVKMCGDGVGGLFLLSDDSTYTDPNPNAATQLAGTLMHVQYDGSGKRVGAAIVMRTTENTAQIACDAIPPASGGNVYMAEYHAVTSTGNCFRSDREALVTIRKSTGTETTLLPRIDAAEGLGPCDDYDPADDLEAARDGSAVFVALPGGVIRIRPTTLLMTPDIDDIFQVHPDGSVLVVARADQGPTGTLRLYKIAPEQAVNGAPHLSDLTPCATITVPNNRGAQRGALTSFVSFAVDPVAPGSFDATVLLSFFTGGGGSPGPGLTAPLGADLHAAGTFAIASPGGSNDCQVIGLVNLEPLDQLAF
jgi:PKD repeat protein